MVERFGYAHEKKSIDSPSTQRARAYFLELLFELRPNVVLALFRAAYFPFTELLKNRQGDIATICDSLESELSESGYVSQRIVRKHAIRRFLSGWQSLKHMEAASSLCQVLQGWARSQNLTGEWCLEHALTVLNEFEAKAGGIVRLSSRPDIQRSRLAELIWESWRLAVARQRLRAIDVQYASITEFEGYVSKVLEFTFKYENINVSPVTGPFYKSISQFKQEVKERFEALKGSAVRGAGKVLKLELDSYLEKVKETMKRAGFKKPPVRWVKEHFKWLIEYQIPPTKQYRKIAKEVRKDESTIREGVASASALIGLTLRPSGSDKHIGRPKGSKTKTVGSGGRKVLREKSPRAKNAGK
jgi:hypothetical protein